MRLLSCSKGSRTAPRRVWALVLLISVTVSLCIPRISAGARKPVSPIDFDQLLAYVACPPKTKLKITSGTPTLSESTLTFDLVMTFPASGSFKETTHSFTASLDQLVAFVALLCEEELERRKKSHLSARGRTALPLAIESKSAEDAVFADLNGDGVIDVALANRDTNSISIILGKPDGTFEQVSDVPTGVAPIRIVAGDFNKDGKIDLVTVNAGNGITGNLSLLIGRGNGTFDPPVAIAAGTQPLDVVVARLNADDNLDLAVGAGAAGVIVLLGNGNGTFQAPIVVPTTDFPGSIVAVDLNLDGVMDLVTNGSILIGNGNGTFKAPAAYAPNGLSPTLVRTGDFNRDGKPDLVTATRLSNIVSVQLGNGDGTVGPARHYIVSRPNELQVADVDGDGILDLVVSADEGLSLILGRGEGTFHGMAAHASAGNIANRLGAFATAVADLNDDGIPDIVVANGGTTSNGLPDAVILPGIGLGRFGPAITMPNQDGSRVVAGDWNGDGKADLAFTIEGGPGTTAARLAIVQRTGSFAFGPPTFYTLPDTKDSPSFLMATDLNNDGKPDLVVANIGAALVSVFMNNGSGMFASQPTVGVGKSPRWVAAGDLDGDGKQDLVVANGGDFGALNGSLSVLFGGGNGTFQAGPTLLTGTSPDSVVVADFDGDGKLDIAAIVESPLFTWSIRVLRGNGNGTFASPQVISLPSDTPATGLSAVDFNRDGIVDLIVTLGSTQVGILLGNGNATFQSPAAFPSSGGFMTPVDLNRDGRPDLVGASGVGIVGVMLSNSIVPLPSTVASILPASRAVSASGGVSATAFATVLNPTSTPFTGCDITPFASLPATFLFQTTDPGTNAPTGTPNTRVTIPANNFQTFVIAFTPTGPFPSTEVEFEFACDGVVPAFTIPGVNTMTLSATSTPGPDIIALAASALPGRVVLASAGAFAVATANVGAGGTVRVGADTGSASLPTTLSWCQTDPLLGTCLGSPSTQPFDLTIGAGATPTFAVFAAAGGPITFDPAANRIFFRISDLAGHVIGATSIAVSTP